MHLIFLKINKIKIKGGGGEACDLLAGRLEGLKLGGSRHTSQDPQLREHIELLKFNT